LISGGGYQICISFYGHQLHFLPLSASKEPPNNSFKPTPHRGVNSVLCATLHAVATPPRGGLTQALELPRMESKALQTFEHAIQDSIELLNHFDSLNKHPPPPEIEVLKRASLVMALAALETYIEDRITEAADAVVGAGGAQGRLAEFYKDSLTNDLKYFHTPSTDRVKTIFSKFLNIDVSEGWTWNHYDPPKACKELNRIAKKRGDIAHRSLRPVRGQTNPHAVTKEELRKIIRFIKDLVNATDVYVARSL